MARPSSYKKGVVDEICARLSKGEPLAAICRDEGMPSDDTVRNWADAKPEVSRAIARAREAGEEALAAECLEIADDSRNDWMAKMAEEGDEKALQYNGEHVQRSKLRIDTRLKLLAKWNPKKWGDRVDLNHGGTVSASLTVSFREPDAESRD